MTGDIVQTAPVGTATGSVARVAPVDALRGLARFGIYLINISAFSLYLLISDAQRAAVPTADTDWASGFVLGANAGSRALIPLSNGKTYLGFEPRGFQRKTLRVWRSAQRRS